jgi:large subunit ribosomal protein L23
MAKRKDIRKAVAVEKKQRRLLRKPIAEKKGPLPRDPWEILQYPLLTEKALAKVETENKLVFIVRRNSNKRSIRWAVEKALEVKVDNVHTLIDMDGRKKAIIKLKPEFKAGDIATRFGML